MSNWFRISQKKPSYDKTPDSLGTPVIVFHDNEVKQAYYGVRITNEPTFYLHGAVIEVGWWQPMPDAPNSDFAPGPWRLGNKQPFNIYDANNQQLGCMLDPRAAELAIHSTNACQKIRKFLEKPNGLVIPELLKEYLLDLMSGAR